VTLGEVEKSRDCTNGGVTLGEGKGDTWGSRKINSLEHISCIND